MIDKLYGDRFSPCFPKTFSLISHNGAEGRLSCVTFWTDKFMKNVTLAVPLFDALMLIIEDKPFI